MKCSDCGNELANGALFCDNCGRKVPVQSQDTEKMFCGNCGAEINSGMGFCGECGSPVTDSEQAEIKYVFCGNCGAKIPDNLQTCSNCGQSLYNDTCFDEDKADKKKRRSIIIIVVLSVLILTLAAIIAGYFISNSDEAKGDSKTEISTISPSSKSGDKSTESPKETETSGNEENTGVNAAKLDTYYVVNCNKSITLRESPSTSSKALRDVPLGSPVSYVEAAANGFAKVIYNGTTGYALQSYLSDNADDIKRAGSSSHNNGNGNAQKSSNTVVSNPSYTTYNDIDFNFSCAYPTHFSVYNEDSKFVRYSVKAPDGTAKLKICATKNGSGLTVQRVLENFKLSFPGTVDYENSGDTWCAVSTIENGQCHYGYFRVTSESVSGFEMHYSQAYHAVYDKYVNDIYDSLDFY